MTVLLTRLPYSFDTLWVKLSMVKLLYPNLVFYCVSVGLQSQVSFWSSWWMNGFFFLFSFFFKEHLRAPQNLRRTSEAFTCVQGNKARSGIVTIIWWASHRFPSRSDRLPTSSLESPTRSHPSVPMGHHTADHIFASQSACASLYRRKGSESSTGRTQRVTQYFMYTL